MSENETTNEPELTESERKRVEMRQAVRFFYDLQKLRIQSGNRTGTDTVKLSDEHKDAITVQSWLMDELEKGALKRVGELLKQWPIYKEFLKPVKGCGPTMSGVLLSEIDITRCETPSALWAYCGLAVNPETGRAVRRTKGEKCGYNPWLKSKVLKVLGDCMIKAGKHKYRNFYDQYKHRKESMRVHCMACDGSGSVKKTADDEGGAKGKKKCANCDGAGTGPWGASKAHRHNAAMRYMVKMFLLDLYKAWRELEGLEIVPPYSEAVLGRTHGDHGGMGISPPAQ